jgi:hypothetical protein
MANLINNERVKLFANWANTVATAMLTVGVFTPVALKVYGIGEPPKNDILLEWLPIVCICAAIALHLGGQLILDLLVDTDEQ